LRGVTTSTDEEATKEGKGCRGRGRGKKVFEATHKNLLPLPLPLPP